MYLSAKQGGLETLQSGPKGSKMANLPVSVVDFLGLFWTLFDLFFALKPPRPPPSPLSKILPI